MSDETKTDDTAQPEPTPDDQPPDGRGPRPTDPNELAKWLVDQVADDDHEPSPPGTMNSG